MNVIDLFSGCGGFSIGFENAGFTITKAIEFNKEIAESYKHNHPNTIMYADDIGNVDNENYFCKGEAPIIVGGPPCQGFSMAGARIREKNAFMQDPRNYLFKHYVNVVKIVRPKVFILENVKGILSKDKGEIFNQIVSAFGDPSNFDGDKYFLHHKVVKAVEYGIPQRRERVVVIGVLNNDFNIDSVFDDAKSDILKKDCNFFKPVSLWDAISDIPQPTDDGKVKLNPSLSDYQTRLRNKHGIVSNHTASHHKDKTVARMNKIHSGENFTVLDEQINSVHSGSYGRLSKDQPTMTITTRFDTPSGGRFTHPESNRTLTPREAARVQSFPDDFEFTGSKTCICKQIGNAVPPKLAFFLAHVVNILLK